MKHNKEQKADSGSVSKGIAKPLVSRRLSSYQKLKLENEKLKSDIYKLVKKSDEFEGLEVRTSYLMQYNLADAAMFGDATKTSGQFSGILSMVAPNCALRFRALCSTDIWKTVSRICTKAGIT